MTVLHFENDLKIMKALKEIEIMKVTNSDHILNIMQEYQTALQNTTTTAGSDSDQHRHMMRMSLYWWKSYICNTEV